MMAYIIMGAPNTHPHPPVTFLRFLRVCFNAFVIISIFSCICISYSFAPTSIRCGGCATSLSQLFFFAGFHIFSIRRNALHRFFSAFIPSVMWRMCYIISIMYLTWVVQRDRLSWEHLVISSKNDGYLSCGRQKHCQNQTNPKVPMRGATAACVFQIFIYI